MPVADADTVPGMSKGTGYKFLMDPPARACVADPVGVLEIAARLGVADRTVHMWIHRDNLPPADYDSINGTRAWEWQTILWWAGETDRCRDGALYAEYVRTFGQPPVDQVARRAPSVESKRPVVKLVDKHPGKPSKPSVPTKKARARAKPVKR